MIIVYGLTCWHCGNDFSYTPPDRLIKKNYPAEFYQGSTVCKDCVPCMGKAVPVYDKVD